VFEDGHWYLRQNASSGAAEKTVFYGFDTDHAVAGDWTKSGADAPGVDRGSWWYLGNLEGNSDYAFPILPFL